MIILPAIALFSILLFFIILTTNKLDKSNSELLKEIEKIKYDNNI